MNPSLEGRVAIVTGAGGGLGAAHAIALARHGAQVLVNDCGDGGEAVVEAIRRGGGTAVANRADVTDAAAVEAMVAGTREQMGPVTILVNNVGILRDRTFAKMDLADFRKVIDVHLMGTVHCTKAVWDGMRDAGGGRIVFTTSSSGLYGNFGQSNYAAAKMALVGLMKTLALEGRKSNIRVNCLSPSASTRMTQGLYNHAKLDALAPEHVAPAVLALVSDAAPTGLIVCAGAGRFEAAHVTLTRGMGASGPNAASEIIARLSELTDRDGEMLPTRGGEQSEWEAANALAESGV